MLTAWITVNGLSVSVFHGEGSSHSDQDRWLVHPFDRGVRVVAIDGITPWRAKAFFGDAGEYAAATVLGLLATSLDLEAALVEANMLLHDPRVVPSRRQAMAAVAALDCHAAGREVLFNAVVAGDCAVWVAESTGDVPRRVAGGDFLLPELRVEWESLKAGNPEWSFDEQLMWEAEFLDDPRTQVRHAVGRYANPVLESTVSSAGYVIVASDGALLDEAVFEGVTVAGLDFWLSELSLRPDRGDLTCIIVTVEDDATRIAMNMEAGEGLPELSEARVEPRSRHTTKARRSAVPASMPKKK